MHRKFFPLLMCLVIGLASSVTIAQQTTPLPNNGEQTTTATLDDVAGNAAAYYGQQVTIDGAVVELVNVRAFLMGVAGANGGSQVIVLNNSGQEFNIGLTQGAPVRVTGVVYPSYNGGGFDQIMAEAAMSGPGAAATATAVSTPSAENAGGSANTGDTSGQAAGGEAAGGGEDTAGQDSSQPDTSDQQNAPAMMTNTAIAGGAGGDTLGGDATGGDTLAGQDSTGADVGSDTNGDAPGGDTTGGESVAASNNTTSQEAADQGSSGATNPQDAATAEGGDTTGGDTTGAAATQSADGTAPTQPPATQIADASGAGAQTGQASAITLLNFPEVILQDRFPDHTIIVINTPDAIAFTQTEGQ
jgi:hypothetical protein